MAAILPGFIHRQFIHYPPAPKCTFPNQVLIVTGASSGLGLEACKSFIQKGASKVILAVRSLDRGHTAAQAIQSSTGCAPSRLDVWPLDLNSYASVLALGERVERELERLDGLVCNAGLGATKWVVTEGNEEQITTMVVSMTLLSLLVLPKLRESAAKFGGYTHLTVTVSELYEVAKFKEREAPVGQLFERLADKEASKKVMGDRYNVAKLMDLFIIKEIAARVPVERGRVIVNGVAPGFCHSNLTRDVDTATVRFAKKILCRPTEVGARTLVYGAGAGPETHGGYLPDCKLTKTKGLTKGEEGRALQKRIWAELSAKLEGVKPGVTKLDL